MPRIDLTTSQVQIARSILKEMQMRDKPEIDVNLSMARLENDIKDFSFGRMALSIPDDHRRVLALIYPEIDSPDGQIKTKAWKRLMKDELTYPYRINPKETGNARKRGMVQESRT